MTVSAGPHVSALYRYPVKGLSPEMLEAVDLQPGETFPGDRAYAIENGPGRFNPDDPRPLPKINFLMLMRNERLASLRTELDAATTTLSISRDGRQVARGDLSSKLGRSMIEQFVAAYMKSELRGAPRIVQAAGHSFSDIGEKCVHLVNLASVRELERLMGKPIDPLRFRANIHIDGVPAFAELSWLDGEISTGDVGFQVFARTERCDATNVDPQTAARDLSIPRFLLKTFGHSDFGVYARVATAGTIRRGDPFRPPSA